MIAFWDIAPCSLVVVDRRFRRSYCLYQGSDGGSTVYYNETTRRNTPQGYHRHTRRCENLESHNK
jgi:hypothetical protein